MRTNIKAEYYDRTGGEDLEPFKISLEAARVNAKLSQAELAQKMGVSRETVRAWEKGKREMKTPYFYVFCSIVGISKDHIFLPTEFAESEQ